MAQTASYLFLFLCIGLTASGDFPNPVPGIPISPNIADACRTSEYAFTFKFLTKVIQTYKSILAQFLFKECEMAENGGALCPHEKATDSSMTRSEYADPCVKEQETKNRPFDYMTEELIKKHNLSQDQVCNDLPNYPMDSGELKDCRDECMESEPKVVCDPNCKYRTANGSCNNLKHPNWGMALTCQRRLMRPYYKEGCKFRESVRGKPLPNTRKLSLELHCDQDLPTIEWTHMFVFFAQILDHDMVQTPKSTTVENKPIQCCPIKEDMHPQCAPISICPEDPVYGKYGITCMNFVRSAVCRTCKLGYRSPINSATSYIDCSVVYGNSDKETASLRSDDEPGCLKYQASEYGELLPPTDDPTKDHCSFPDTNEICFKAGDSRCNLHSGLTFMHTILMREHNWIARKLKCINPHWCGDRIFQEARRILIAQWQCIVYKDFVPVVLGIEATKKYDLQVSEGTGRTCYNCELNPSCSAEFTTGPFRFGHTLINHKIVPEYCGHNATNLMDDFFQPFNLYHGSGSEICKHACKYMAQEHDRHIINDITDYLFKVRGDKVGLDLIATDIQRGRDHGMPPYVDFVYYCSGKKITCFDDLVLYGLMTIPNVVLLKKSYCDVRDIDVRTGLFYEIHVILRAVGNTAACIIGPMFHNLKFGDRFYFEHKDQAGSFTDAQLLEIKKATWTAILCRHEKITEMQTNCLLSPFVVANNIIKCEDLDKIDLSHWKEENTEDCSDGKEEEQEDCSDGKEEDQEDCSDGKEKDPEDCSDGKEKDQEDCSDGKEEDPEDCSDGKEENPEDYSDEY